jgi:hypothetical protein
MRACPQTARGTRVTTTASGGHAKRTGA